MVLVSRLGQMVQNTLVSGVKIEHMAKVNLFMLTVMFMTDFGLTIKLTDLEFTNM